MEKIVSDISRALIRIAWGLGPKGLKGECCENLTMSEFLALDKIYCTTECCVQEVGTCLFFTKSGATRIVNRLEKKGYIEKIRSSDDGRVCCLKLTIMGIKVLESAEKRYLKQFEDIVSNIDKYSSEEIGNFIKSFAKAVEE